MSDYISREAFVAEQRRLYCADCDRRKGTKNGKTVFCYEIGDAPCRACRFDDVLTSLEDYPAADVVAVVHGEWEPGKEISRTMLVDETLAIEYDAFYCSACGRRYKEYVLIYNYCPNCGAKMSDIPTGSNGGADNG